MSGSENSTVEKAFDNYLRAEYEEQQYSRWAPSGLPKATEKRVAAARALDKMGVDISVMRRQRIEAAIGEMVERLALEGVRATVQRRGARIVLESPDRVDIHEKALSGFLQWMKSKGVHYCSSWWPGRKGGPASVVEFRLTAPGQDSWSPKCDPSNGSVEIAPAESADAFLARAAVASRAVSDWWTAEGVAVFVSVGNNGSGFEASRACLVLESRANIDALHGTFARFEAWMSANGMQVTQSGGEMRLGVHTRMTISPGPTKRDWVSARCLDDKAEKATVGVGRMAIEHVMRGPKYQPTSREKRKALAKKLGEEWGYAGVPSALDWREWTG